MIHPLVMRRMLVFAAFAVSALVAAALLRARDAPYIAYEQGNVAASLDGLARRAEAGDGFAAYLIARAHHAGSAGAVDLQVAAAWYMAAARSGELRGVAPYLAMVLAQLSDADTCRIAMVLLELAARAGDAGALASLGGAYQSGRCVAPDRARAASHYAAAARLDRRYTALLDRLTPPLSADEVRALRPLPETFDLNSRQALARFVAEAPALLPDALR